MNAHLSKHMSVCACVCLCVPGNVFSEQWGIGRVELDIECKLPVVTWRKREWFTAQGHYIMYRISTGEYVHTRTRKTKSQMGISCQDFCAIPSIHPSAYLTHLSNAEQLLESIKPGTSRMHTHTQWYAADLLLHNLILASPNSNGFHHHHH